MQSSSIFIPGVIFNEFKIDKILGRGTYGTVMKARSTRDNRIRALKAQNIAADFGQIQSEFYILQAVRNHEGCLQIYNAFQAFGHQIFELELLGPSLHNHIRVIRKFTINNTIMFIFQMTSTLEFLQSRSILHRDISSANLCLSLDFRRVVLCDFGIATMPGLLCPLINMNNSYHAPPEVNDGIEYSAPHEFFELFLAVLQLRGQVDLWLGSTLAETIEKKRRLVACEDLTLIFNRDNYIFIHLFHEIMNQQHSGVNISALHNALGHRPEDYHSLAFHVVVTNGHLQLESDVL